LSENGDASGRCTEECQSCKFSGPRLTPTNLAGAWLKVAGADVKDAQAQMRHSRASTTLDYQQFVPESQVRVVEKLSSLSTMIQ
jgi:hypothetical protein